MAAQHDISVVVLDVVFGHALGAGGIVPELIWPSPVDIRPLVTFMIRSVGSNLMSYFGLSPLFVLFLLL